MASSPSTATRSERTCARLQGRARGRAGFTLIEVLITLVVVGVGLAALLELQMGSVALCHRSELATQATFLAEQKLAESLVGDLPDTGTIGGTAAFWGTEAEFSWRRSVEPAGNPGLESPVELGELRRVTVEVMWREGSARRSVRMATLVAGWE